MRTTTAWLHTVAASLLTTTAFFFFLYFVAPIAESVMMFFGKWFVPERFGGGGESNNPGFLTVIFRGVMMSGFSAFGAFSASNYLFSRANMRIAAAVFALVVIFWASLFIVAGVTGGVVSMPLIAVLVGAAPALGVAYFFWKDDL